MHGANHHLFRPNALTRASSPDNLDRLMHVVRAKDWIPLLALTGLLAVGGVWAVAGSVPTKVFGRGVLLRPRRIVSVQALGGGRLEALLVHTGDAVRKGDLLGRVDQSELRRRIQDDRQLLTLLHLQDQTKTTSQQQQTSLQQQQDQLERKFLQSQRRSLERSLADAQALTEGLRQRYLSVQQLLKEGLIAKIAPEVIESEKAWRDNQAQVLEYKAKLEQIDGQVKQLETRFSGLARETLDAATTRQNQMAELQARIAQSELQLSKSGDVLSEYTGRVAEVFVAAGQVLPAGGTLLSLEIQDAEAPLVGLLYFPVKDGKKVQPGMLIQLTPDTIERHRFGGILAKVAAVSPLPVTREGALSNVGNPDLVREIMTDGACLEVTAYLEPDPSTFSRYRWSSSRGPQLKLSSGLTVQSWVTVERRAPATYLMPLLREASGTY
jgi:NHLM bacteriocin system secretion protein